MKLTDAKPGMRVTYAPPHLAGMVANSDLEHGTVSSVGTKHVFVRFDKHVSKLGWDGATSQSCAPADLKAVPNANA